MGGARRREQVGGGHVVPPEPGRQHADHGERLAVELEGSAHRTGVAAQGAAPERVGEHDGVTRRRHAGLVLPEEPAPRGGDA